MNFTSFDIFSKELRLDSNKKLLINTINAHSYNIAKKDVYFQKALFASHILLPDGISIVWAVKLFKGETINRISGYDLFEYEMNRLNKISGKCFFLGSNNETLEKIEKRVKIEFPKIHTATFSPPYKKEFSDEENKLIINTVNAFQPDVLFIGMTAPKQEKWAFTHFDNLNAKHICSIGAVFDFYAGNIKRAPISFQKMGLEWFYRLIKEPRRMWKRYLIGNIKFIYYILKEKYSM